LYYFGEINWQAFFKFDKKLITDGAWAMLPLSSKAVFPVIGCHSNDQGIAFPGENTIAALAGLSPKTARKGIRGLDGFPGFAVHYYTTARGRRSKKFRLRLLARDHDKYFFFHRSILEGGNWRMLRPSAKALYPSMRCFSFYGFDEDEGMASDDQENRDFYGQRGFDYCRAQVHLLSEKAGITRSRFYTALSSLEEHFLVEEAQLSNGEPVWKVYHYPTRHYEREGLNRQLKKTFRSEIDE